MVKRWKLLARFRKVPKVATDKKHTPQIQGNANDIYWEEVRVMKE